MRIICLNIEHFLSSIEILARPELTWQPVIIGGHQYERNPVLDCSAKAAACGVVPGIPLRQAHHLCPDAVFLPLDEALVRQTNDDLLAILDNFSPTVENPTPGHAFLDITGSEMLFGLEPELARRLSNEVHATCRLEPRAGAASSKTVAAIAASMAGINHPCIVPPGYERNFLAPLPVSLLPLTEESRTWLERIGLRTIGQVADLSEDGLISQLGPEGLPAWRLARGIDTSQITPHPRPAAIERSLIWDEPADSLDFMLAVAKKLLDLLIPSLGTRQQSCGEIRLTFQCENAPDEEITLPLKIPTGNRDDLLRRVRNHLENATLPAGANGLRIILAKLGPDWGRQPELATERMRKRRAMIRAAGRLRERFGYPSLLRIIHADPACRIPERRWALAEFPPSD
jgi:nucleotidyltransferase/DNA polymerase involved in DNA repair